MKKGTKGFTLIELLVVIAIIAILSTVVMVGLNSARTKGRDAKRIADIKQVQAALELFFDNCGGYPATLDVAEATGCSEEEGITLGTYINPLPINPTPGGIDYVYDTNDDRNAYSIAFQLEGTSGSLASGDHFATNSGFVDEAPTL